MKLVGYDGKEWPETFDAVTWADAWMAQIAKTPNIATDKGAMIGWFANAIIRGYDHKAQEPVNEQKQLLSMLRRSGIDFEVITDTDMLESWDKNDDITFDTIVRCLTGKAIHMEDEGNCYFFFDKGRLVFTGAE